MSPVTVERPTIGPRWRPRQRTLIVLCERGLPAEGAYGQTIAPDDLEHESLAVQCGSYGAEVSGTRTLDRVQKATTSNFLRPSTSSTRSSPRTSPFGASRSRTRIWSR